MRTRRETVVPIVLFLRRYRLNRTAPTAPLYAESRRSVHKRQRAAPEQALNRKREQRNDATNALAIAPRTAITYERNERTIQALEESGVTCIGIDDSELVRGLGGPRCMTMPLRRAPASSS